MIDHNLEKQKNNKKYNIRKIVLYAVIEISEGVSLKDVNSKLRNKFIYVNILVFLDIM